MLHRNQKGAVLGFIAAATFVFVLIGLGLIKLLFIVTSAREVNSAVNAGALNVAKRAQQVTIKPENVLENQFNDITDEKGRIGLKNVNRMWGKALLVSLNSQEMAGGGAHANSVYLAAKQMNDRLSDELNDEKNLHGFFNQVAQANSSRMAGAQTSVMDRAGQDWQSSLVNRGIETNIEFNADQLPSNSDASLMPVKLSEKKFLRGYSPVMVGGKPFMFVPFEHKEQPHLISSSSFDKNIFSKLPIANISKPVPNAFSVSGGAQSDSFRDLKSKAYAVSNPEHNFKLAIPHGFIRITLGQHSTYTAANANTGSGSYTPGMPQVDVRSASAGSGTLTTIDVLGLDYVPPTLYQAIYGLSGDHARVTKILLQRIREVDADFQAGDLPKLLSSAFIVPGLDEYYIYPLYKNGNEDPKMVAGSAPQAIAGAPWISPQAQAEGVEENVGNDFSFGGPDVLIPILAGAGIPVYGPQIVQQTGTQTWKAGTGFDGCLGELRIDRDATIVSTGVVITP